MTILKTSLLQSNNVFHPIPKMSLHQKSNDILMTALVSVGTTDDLFSYDLDPRSKVFLKVIFGNIGSE